MKNMALIFTLLVTVLLTSCSSKPPLDLSDTKLYMYPNRYFDKNTDFTFSFSEKEREKALRHAKNRNLDILYEVYVNKDGTVRSVKKRANTKYADQETIIKIRHQLKGDDFFRSFGLNSAFFYGVTIRTEIEIYEH